MGGSDRHFPATEWTRLLDHSQKEAILAELCTKYWKPLYSYLRSSGFGNDKAKDLVQDFFTEKVIDQELVQQADRTRGKLRTFLLTALRNHVINAGRSQKVPAMLHEMFSHNCVQSAARGARPSTGGSFTSGFSNLESISKDLR
jgi:DNA-directed RNA polymerase specialized sigma24 family protein